MNKQYPTYFLKKDYNAKLESFVENFINEGFEYFKDEFSNIDSFLEKVKCEIKAGGDRDDQSLRSNPKEKYLLEMVSFKIHDRLNREEFNKRKNTLIIMPDCLSIHEKECEKAEFDYGSVCKRCQENCQAYQITELAKKYKAKVLFSKRKLSEQLQHYSDKMGDLGVIGVACVMMLANGMRTAHEAGVPSRGVLLNFTGCEHWNDEAFASEFNIKYLEEILEEKYGSKD